MKVVPTPEFTQKVLALSHEDLRKVVEGMAELENANAEFLLANKNILQLNAEQSQLYVLSHDGVRLIFSIEENDEEEKEYAVLADVILYDSPRTPERNWDEIVKNVGSGSQLNPLNNNSINPRVNSSLNPRVNSRLNPSVNSRINPRVNSRINPRVNSRVNYRVNSRLNPLVNSRVNPRVNSAINPNINRGFGGPYIYDLNGRREKFAVRADDNVLLIFNNSAEFDSIAVQDSEGGYAVFDRDNNWVQHWVDNKKGGYLVFTTGNDWTGFVI